MNAAKYIAYYRVSTQKQGQSGLGLEAQKAAVKKFLLERNGELLSEFTEIETGKGSNALDRRPELRQALAACKKHKAILVIAKLDRLARNVHFVSGLIESGVEFKCVDMPEANKVMLQMHAVMSEWERDAISKRTKEALASAKARGVRLGSPKNLTPYTNLLKQKADNFALHLRGQIEGFTLRGLTQLAMVEELNRMGIRTARGGEWRLIQLQRIIKRLKRITESMKALSD